MSHGIMRRTRGRVVEPVGSGADGSNAGIRAIGSAIGKFCEWQCRRAAGRSKCDPALAGGDPGAGQALQRDQASRRAGRHSHGGAHEPAGQCQLRARCGGQHHPDGEGLSHGRLLFRRHRPALADRVGHEFRSRRRSRVRPSCNAPQQPWWRLRWWRSASSSARRPRAAMSWKSRRCPSRREAAWWCRCRTHPKPLTFLLMSGGGRYDADLSVHVGDRGPNAQVVDHDPAGRAGYRRAIPHRDAGRRAAGGCNARSPSKASRPTS